MFVCTRVCVSSNILLYNLYDHTSIVVYTRLTILRSDKLYPLLLFRCLLLVKPSCSLNFLMVNYAYHKRLFFIQTCQSSTYNKQKYKTYVVMHTYIADCVRVCNITCLANLSLQASRNTNKPRCSTGFMIYKMLDSFTNITDPNLRGNLLH